MQAKKTMVVMSNSEHFVKQLISVGGELGVAALTAETQRRSFDGNVTWFRFIAKDEEDGRLRPKQRLQAASEGLSVCHVWQAETVILQTGPGGQLQRCLIRLPRPPDPGRQEDSATEGCGGVGVEPVFAAMFRVTNTKQWSLWKELIDYQRRRQLSAPARGSIRISNEDPTAPPSTARLHLAVRLIGASETQAVHIREVLSDAHEFCEELAGPSANIATEGASAAAAEPIIVVEYSSSSSAV